MSFEDPNFDYQLPTCPPGLPSFITQYIQTPSTFILQLIVSLISFFFACIVFFFYNPSLLQQRANKNNINFSTVFTNPLINKWFHGKNYKLTNNTLWILFFLISCVRGIMDSVRFGKEAEQQKDAEFIFASTCVALLLHAFCSYFLTIGLNFQRKHRTIQTNSLVEILDAAILQSRNEQQQQAFGDLPNKKHQKIIRALNARENSDETESEEEHIVHQDSQDENNNAFSHRRSISSGSSSQHFQENLPSNNMPNIVNMLRQQQQTEEVEEDNSDSSDYESDLDDKVKNFLYAPTETVRTPLFYQSPVAMAEWKTDSKAYWFTQMLLSSLPFRLLCFFFSFECISVMLLLLNLSVLFLRAAAIGDSPIAYEWIHFSAILIQRLPLLVLALAVLFRKGPIVKAKILLFISLLLLVPNELPLSFWYTFLGNTPLNSCFLYIGSVYDIIVVLYIFSLLFLFLFVRAEYFRCAEFSLYSLNLSIQEHIQPDMIQ